MAEYLHLSDEFPTAETYRYHVDLNKAPPRFSSSSPYEAVYLSNSKYSTEKHRSHWMEFLVEGGVNGLPKKEFTITLEEDTQIYHLHTLEDMKKLKDGYGYNRTNTPKTHYKRELERRDQFLEEIIKPLQAAIETEMKKIRDESNETKGDVYFKCSKKVSVILYSRELDQIVFEPQFQTVTRPGKNKNGKCRIVPLKTPKIYELMKELSKQEKILEPMERLIAEHVTACFKENLNYNKLRRHGYHGIELHPEFCETIKEIDSYNDNFLDFFKWLSFPQLIVINWCFKKIKAKDIDLYSYRKK